MVTIWGEIKHFKGAIINPGWDNGSDLSPLLYNARIAWSGYALPFWCPIIISLDHPEEGTYSALNWLLPRFREIGGNFTTLPQMFKEHGYHSIIAGKIFHRFPFQQTSFQKVGLDVPFFDVWVFNTMELDV